MPTLRKIVATPNTESPTYQKNIDSGQVERRVHERVGVARLVGNTCQGCHLTIPATEVERIKKSAGNPIAFCDNCGAILVP